MKNSTSKHSRYYKAQGFVELLIAILVAGITSISLMSIAALTLRDIAKNERTDELTQVAIEGAEMAKRIGEKAGQDSTLFPPINQNKNNCFNVIGDLQEPKFETNGGRNESTFAIKCNYENNPSQCRSSVVKGKYDDNIFRVFCITNSSDGDSGLVVGKVVSGLINCKKLANTDKCEVSNYEYVTVFKIGQ